jgi:uncharacterized protein YpbB
VPELTKTQLAEPAAQLRIENASLRDELSPSSRKVPDSRGENSLNLRKARGRAWTVLATALILVGPSLDPVAIVANWAKLQLSDTTTFVYTFAPLAQDPDVQAFITAEVARTIDEQITIDQLTLNVFDAISRVGLPPAAELVLNAFTGVAVNYARTVMATVRSVSLWVQSLSRLNRCSSIKG